MPGRIAKINVTSVEAPDTAYVGTKATVTVTVMNSGQKAGSKDISLKLNESTAGTQSVTIEPGESKTLTFNVNVDEEGEHTLRSDGVSTTLTAEQSPYNTYMGWEHSDKMPPRDVEATLTLYNWSLRDKEHWWNVGVYAFHKVYPNVEVNFKVFTSEDAAFTKMKLNHEFADVVSMSSGEPRRWKEGGVIEPVNPDLIPMWDNIYEEARTQIEGVKMDGEYYSVPYDFGMTSLAYDKEKLDELGVPENWRNTYKLLKHPALEGKVTIHKSAWESLDMAALAAGVPREQIYDNLTGKWMDMALDEARKWMQNSYGYWSTNAGLQQDLKSGKAVVANSWGDSFVWVRAGEDWVFGNEDDLTRFEWMVPEEGLIYWTEQYAVPKGLKERNPTKYKLAHALINSYLDPVSQANEMHYWGYAPVVPDAFDNMGKPEQEITDYLNLDNPDFSKVSKYVPNKDEWATNWLEIKQEVG